MAFILIIMPEVYYKQQEKAKVCDIVTERESHIRRRMGCVGRSENTGFSQETDVQF